MPVQVPACSSAMWRLSLVLDNPRVNRSESHAISRLGQALV